MRKRALSFTPNFTRINKSKSTEIKEIDCKSVIEKENYLDFTDSESDSSLTLIV